MKVHLEYINDSSDKFWEIETKGNSFTVTYGRNGTNGQSQTKTFEDEARCLKEAEKLVAEKTRKGYSENGEVSAFTSKPKTEKESDLQAVLDEYAEIVRTTNTAALLPFLENRVKGSTEAVKKQIRKQKTYWLSYIDLSAEPEFKPKGKDAYSWGMRGTEKHRDIIVLSAIALFNEKEITPWDEAFGYLSQVDNDFAYSIVKWAKPAWINAFLLDKLDKNEWITFEYESLRKLEEDGLIAYEPELFAKVLARYHSYNRKGNSSGYDFIDYLVGDEVAISRDIPQLFNYETALHTQAFPKPGVKIYEGIIIWELIYNRLLEENKIDRLWFIENCIQVQTKEWNGNLRSFFRKRLADCKPQAAELVIFQSSIFNCLHASLGVVVNFGIDLIKSIYAEPNFDHQIFLEWVEPVMMRVDCKGGLKSLLGIFDKIVKTNPEWRPQVALLTADVFVIPDLTLQERAFKTLEKVIDLNDTELTGKLEMYLPQMQGNVMVQMSALLQLENDHHLVGEELEKYACVAYKRQYLLDENRVVPLSDWNEIVFLFGEFISSNDVIVAERLINAFVTQQDLFPEDAVEQLKSYSKQLQNSYFPSSFKNIVAGTLGFLIEKKRGTYSAPSWMSSASQVVQRAIDLFAEVQKKLAAQSTLPLLCFPSHAPHWVAPVVLVERLIAYKNNEWDIDPLDLTIAISRMPREEIQEAVKLCDQLDKETRSLIRFALGVDDKIDLREDSFFKKILKGGTSDHSVNHAMWAVAARTYNPSGYFPEFEETALGKIPNVVSEFIPVGKVVTKKNEYRNYQTQSTEEVFYRELVAELPSGVWNKPKNLLYSLDIYERQKNQYVYQFLSLGDVLFWHSIMPQNDQALASVLLRYTCQNPDEGSDELNAFLYITGQPEFVFTETSMLVLGCSLFNKNIKT